PGVVDAQHARQPGLVVEVAGQGAALVARGGLDLGHTALPRLRVAVPNAAHKDSAASRAEARTLNPAMEMPKSSQGTTSQGAKGWFSRISRICSMVAPGGSCGAWHSAVPCHHFCSTPTWKAAMAAPAAKARPVSTSRARRAIAWPAARTASAARAKAAP